jgi:hypothetical protein
MFRDASHFSQSSAVINRMLAIGSTVIDNGRGGKAERIQGNSCVKINGEVQYLIPKNLQTTKNEVNAQQSEASRRTHGPRVKLGFLKDMFNLLKEHHSFCDELRWIGQTAADYDMLVPAGSNPIGKPFDRDVAQEQVRELQARINQKSEFLEVAAFSSDEIQSNRVYYVKFKGKSRYLEMYDKEVEGVMYPLFFPHNEPGYNHDRRKELSFYQYVVARILQPEPEDQWEYPFKDDCEDDASDEENDGVKKTCCSNRFQFFSRLMQYYLVEGYARACDYRLKWMRKSRDAIMGKATTVFDEKLDTRGMPPTYDDMGDDMDEPSIPYRSRPQGAGDDEYCGDGEALDGERLTLSASSKSFLADSVTGSPRHLKALALNAIAVVSQLGPPTAFITLTCNPNWPELIERLPEGQTAFDRPDLTVLVFRARLKAFLHNLRHGKYFGGGKKVYIMHVIEYQHRGLPHAHIVIKLDNCGDTQEEKLEFMGKYIRARFPPDTPANEPYRALIRQHMVHKCSSACLKSDNKTCKRGYTERGINKVDSFHSKGYPVYKRPTKEDLRVVPHNKDILFDWNGHANVEFCGHTFTVMYLYKYLFKGNKKVTLELNNLDDVDEEDEIKEFQRGRMICAMQAMWCMFGYQTYPGSDPSVIFIKVKLMYHLQSILNENKVCDLIVYFNRPRNEIFKDLKYADFFAEWDYSRLSKVPKYPKKEDGTLFEVDIRGIAGFKIYIYKRKQSHICRMGKVPFRAGEIYYLRLLMKEVPAYWYSDLLKYEKDGEEFQAETFQEAAVARGLVKKAEVARSMFKEELACSTPREFRMFFVHSTLHGFPTVELFEEEEVWHQLARDYYDKCGNWELARNDMLKELARLFKTQPEGKTMADFGLPDWQSTETELRELNLLFGRNFC